MPIAPLVIALVLIVLAYQLLIRGWLFKIIICSSFLFLAPLALASALPSLKATAIAIGAGGISWAALIPLLIVMLAMMTIRTKENYRMRFHDLITNTGFLTAKGSELVNSTFSKGVTDFLSNFDTPSTDQLHTIKSVLLKTVSDIMADKLKSAPNTLVERIIDGEVIKNGDPLPGGGFIKLGTENTSINKDTTTV